MRDFVPLVTAFFLKSASLCSWSSLLSSKRNPVSVHWSPLQHSYGLCSYGLYSYGNPVSVHWSPLQHTCWHRCWYTCLHTSLHTCLHACLYITQSRYTGYPLVNTSGQSHNNDNSDQSHNQWQQWPITQTITLLSQGTCTAHVFARGYALRLLMLQS